MWYYVVVVVIDFADECISPINTYSITIHALDAVRYYYAMEIEVLVVEIFTTSLDVYSW